MFEGEQNFLDFGLVSREERGVSNFLLLLREEKDRGCELFFFSSSLVVIFWVKQKGEEALVACDPVSLKFFFVVFHFGFFFVVYPS